MGFARHLGLAVSAAILLSSGSAGQQPGVVASLSRDATIRSALEAVRTTEARTIADQIRFCEVPAPPFNETKRGDLLRKEFAALGLQNVRVDRAGNVLGDRPGASAHPHLVVAAHLDTVFPDGTDVRVKREGAILRGPGIGDNCRGLAGMVAIVRALRDANVQTSGSMTFVADVGEEGLGDLRGMKALFAETLKGQIDRFVSLDGTGLSLVTVSVGSHRYRVTFKGPGGHSFGAFGTPSAVAALGRAVAKIADFPVSSAARATFNVGRIGGGTSVNAIAAESWMEVDLRSAEASALAALDNRFHTAVNAAAQEENARWGRPGVVTAAIELVGDRPAGSISVDSPIVQTAHAAARALGLTLANAEGSTDANVPISLKIPAITLGVGGAGADAHAATESFDTTDAWKATELALLVAVALAQ